MREESPEVAEEIVRAKNLQAVEGQSEISESGKLR